MRISVTTIIAIVATATASASAEEPPVTGLRRDPKASTNDGDTHLRTRASGGKPIAGASTGRARGLRKRKNRGKSGKGGGGSKSGKGGGGAKSGKGGGGAKSGKGEGGAKSGKGEGGAKSGKAGGGGEGAGSCGNSLPCDISGGMTGGCANGHVCLSHSEDGNGCCEKVGSCEGCVIVDGLDEDCSQGYYCKPNIFMADLCYGCCTHKDEYDIFS